MVKEVNLAKLRTNLILLDEASKKIAARINAKNNENINNPPVKIWFNLISRLFRF